MPLNLGDIGKGDKNSNFQGAGFSGYFKSLVVVTAVNLHWNLLKNGTLQECNHISVQK